MKQSDGQPYSHHHQIYKGIRVVVVHQPLTYVIPHMLRIIVNHTPQLAEYHQVDNRRSLIHLYLFESLITTIHILLS